MLFVIYFLILSVVYTVNTGISISFTGKFTFYGRLFFVFSSLIKSLRTEKGLSQTQLAKEIGVSAGNIGDWEIGRSKPGYVALAALSRFFGVSADYLLKLSPVKTGDEELGQERLDAIKREQGLACDGSPLDEMEADLVAMFRLLPEEEREDVFDIVHLKYKRRVEKKRESIYWTYFEESTDGESGPAGGHKGQRGTA